MTAKRWIVCSSSLAAAAAVLAAGCGTKSKFPPSPLTGEEAEALALEVGAVSSMAWLEKRGDGSGEYEFVIPCPASGNVTFSGTSKAEKHRALVISLDVDGTQRYSACVVVVEGGETMTLSGVVNEGLSLAVEPVTDAEAVEIKGMWSGAVVWSRGNSDSIECEVDLALDAWHVWSAWSQETNLRGGLDGTFCTIAVDAPLEEWYETQ